MDASEHAAIEVSVYGVNDYLSELRRTKKASNRQLDYLHRYLSGLGASSVVMEPFYFDRDYLAEFSAFYGISAAGYSNRCKRLHFFGGPPFDQESLHKLLDTRRDATERQYFQDNYLGFCVIRPLPNAPLGRTVLKWWTPNEKVHAPARQYFANLCGIPLSVTGLAWQQQDTGTAACATVALWSMLHSAAFDERHAIPTTVSITSAAHGNAATTLLPSEGLSQTQMRQAILAHGFAPLSVNADKTVVYESTRLDAFSPERFRSLCGAYIGSGYAVLVLGQQLKPQGRHAVCAVGFDPGNPRIYNGLALEDAGIENLYLHDDNIGMAARFAVTEVLAVDAADPDKKLPITVLKRNPPARAASLGAEKEYPDLIPTSLLVALNPEVRTSGDRIWRFATMLARTYARVLAHPNKDTPLPPVVVGLRFCRLSDYVGQRLENGLGSQLGRVRRALSEDVAPMSLFLGVVRIGVFYRDEIRLQLEVLYDTTDNICTNRPFAHLVLDASAKAYVEKLAELVPLGKLVDAYSP